MTDVIAFAYRNHRGEVAMRRAGRPFLVWGGREWHGEDDWCLVATCLDRGALRWFRLRDCRFAPGEALPVPQAELRAAAVCHDDQLTLWASEVLDHLQRHLKAPEDYEGLLDLHGAVEAAVRHVVASAFAHPALTPRPADHETEDVR
jgi:hypothetical protein